jgi:hypothetical protein
MELQKVVFEQSQLCIHLVVVDSAFPEQLALQWQDTRLHQISQFHCTKVQNINNFLIVSSVSANYAKKCVAKWIREKLRKERM